MRMLRSLLVLGVISAVPLAALAGGTPDSKASAKAPVSVADFAVMLAQSDGSGRPVEAGQAVDALVSAGVPVGDPKAALSEGKLAEILGYYGVRATTDHPAKAVSPERAQAATLLLAGSLTQGAAKVSPSPDTLDDCLAAANHGQCVNCCKALGTKANSCARFCFQINKPSASEPLP
jgi:hypothetical protein